MLDEDDDGDLTIMEITHALRTNEEAKEHAEHFDTLHDLVALATARRRRRSSSAKKKSTPATTNKVAPEEGPH